MAGNAQGRKKSEFVQQNTVLANSYLDYVVNGSNYKISPEQSGIQASWQCLPCRDLLCEHHLDDSWRAKLSEVFRSVT